MVAVDGIRIGAKEGLVFPSQNGDVAVTKTVTGVLTCSRRWNSSSGLTNLCFVEMCKNLGEGTMFEEMGYINRCSGINTNPLNRTRSSEASKLNKKEEKERKGVTMVAKEETTEESSLVPSKLI